MSLKSRFSPEQQQENISRNQIGEFFESHGFVTSAITTDLGEDILVRIYDKGVSTGISFYVQLKSTDNIEKYRLRTGDISYPFQVKDLEHWSSQAITVILIVWDINQRQGWWIWINNAIKWLNENNSDWLKNETVNVHLSSKNKVAYDGLREIRKLLTDLYYPIISRDKELTINAKFTFPTTPEGKAKFEELKRHFATGDHLELDGKYIEVFDFPDWWKRLYGAFDPAQMQLKFGSKRSNTARPSQFEFISDDSHEIVPYIELWIIKQGEEEITISNDQQKHHLIFSIIVNKTTREHQIRIKSDFSNIDGMQALQVLKIQQVLHDGGTIRLTLLDTNEIINIPVSPGLFPASDQALVDFVEKICFIQNSMGIKITFPKDGSFTQKDVDAANELVSIIEKGNYQQKGMVFTVELLKPGIEKFIEGITDQESPIYCQLMADESHVEIFSQKIELGPMLQRITGHWRMPLAEARAWLEKADDEDSLAVRLVEVELFEEFEKWVKR